MLLQANELKMQILRNICHCIKEESKMRLWSDDAKVLEAFKNSSHFSVAKSLEEANFVILNKKPKDVGRYVNKHIFVLDYDMLSDIPESFGAFFWKKGRPNIVFIKPRVEKQSLKLSPELSKYIEEKIW